MTTTLFIHLKSLLMFQFIQLLGITLGAAAVLVTIWLAVKHRKFILFYFHKFIAEEYGSLFRTAFFALVFFGAGWMLMRGLQPRMPHEKIDHTLLRERLFVNVRQDSLQHLAEQHGVAFDGPSLFGNRANITLPIGPTQASQSLKTELDSLAAVYCREVEVEPTDGGVRLSCPTVRQQGVRFVCVPVVVLINLLGQQHSSNP
ncbi:MAG: hypothetical protein IKQ03_10495 [Prevotella sp.]|nr:hypothetical protein [Prevotella sp.]